MAHDSSRLSSSFISLHHSKHVEILHCSEFVWLRALFIRKFRSLSLSLRVLFYFNLILFGFFPTMLSSFQSIFFIFVHSSAWFYFHLMLNNDSRLSMPANACSSFVFVRKIHLISLKTWSTYRWHRIRIRILFFHRLHSVATVTGERMVCVYLLAAVDAIHTIIFYSIEKQTILNVMKQNYVFNRIW